MSQTKNSSNFLKANRRADKSDGGLLYDFNPMLPDSEKWPLEGKEGAEFHPLLNVTEHDYIVPRSVIVP